VASGPTRPKQDRRVTPDRRAVARGGRRREERYESDRETVLGLLKEITALREENALLRRAAIAFGGLAERLNMALRSDRL
jgi:hypothetical protein